LIQVQLLPSPPDPASGFLRRPCPPCVSSEVHNHVPPSTVRRTQVNREAFAQLLR